MNQSISIPGQHCLINNKKMVGDEIDGGTVTAPTKRTHSEDSRSSLKRPKNAEKAPTPAANYYFEDGLRKVEPYVFKYETYSKGRWLDRSIYDVFCVEFADNTAEYYRNAIKSGKILVNDAIVHQGYLIKNNDRITHLIHRHEPPVTDALPLIVHQDHDILVVDKPSSIPIHPSGRYNHNTLVQILQSHHGFNKLSPMHRLDRLTSGILILAKNPHAAQKFQIQNVKEKVYLTRVHGDFPFDETTVNEPVKVACHKLSLNIVAADGKPSTTVFKKVFYDAKTDSTVLEVYPKTGRTHQIRVHLQFLGHPVLNDPLYASKDWRVDFGKGVLDQKRVDGILSKMMKDQFEREGKAIDQERISATIESKAWSHVYQERRKGGSVSTADIAVMDATTASTEEVATKELSLLAETADNRNQTWFDRTCLNCVKPFADPRPHQMMLYLHAWKYEGEGRAFETPRPSWAEVDFDKALFTQFGGSGGVLESHS